jgi:hypothetical protein
LKVHKTKPGADTLIKVKHEGKVSVRTADEAVAVPIFSI